MTVETSGAYASEQTNAPADDLKKLDILVGAWELQDDTRGQIRFEWLEGGFFLMQHYRIEFEDHTTSGIEIIGHERAFGATESSVEIKSRIYDNTGNTFDYIYELEDDTLTIWGGEKGSPAYYRGTFSPDGNKLSGAWVYPGGGYKSSAVRLSR
jgi:hypothetical protein